MVFRTTLILLVVHLTPAQLLLKPAADCDFKHRLVSGEVLTITNPYWPATYRPGDTCRWIFDSPFGSTCHLKCSFVGLPESRKCFLDALLVSSTGNRNLKNADAYCGQSTIDTKSVGTRISLGLRSNVASPGGRFSCVVITETELHPNMLENSYVDLHRRRRLEDHTHANSLLGSNLYSVDDEDAADSTEPLPHTYLIRPLGVKVLKSFSEDPGYQNGDDELTTSTKSLPSIYGMSLRKIKFKSMAEDPDYADDAPLKKVLFPVRRRSNVYHHNFRRVPMYHKNVEEEQTTPEDIITHYTRPLGVKILESMGDDPIYPDDSQDE